MKADLLPQLQSLETRIEGRALVVEMLVSLVTSPTALGEVAHTVPETLALDVDALQRLQNEVQAVVLTCGWLHACAQDRIAVAEHTQSVTHRPP